MLKNHFIELSRGILFLRLLPYASINSQVQRVRSNEHLSQSDSPSTYLKYTIVFFLVDKNRTETSLSLACLSPIKISFAHHPDSKTETFILLVILFFLL